MGARRLVRCYMPIDRGRIATNGWSQGKLFRPEDSARLIQQHGARLAGRTPVSPTTLILASHGCRHLSHIGDEEPDVTVFPILSIAGIAGLSFSPVSVHRPRAWHFEMKQDGSVIQCELLARTAFFIPRGELEVVTPWPGAALMERHAREFAPWLRVRWDRPAFPDEFNERLRVIQSKVRDTVKTSSSADPGIADRH